jgi:hypothetical protein
VETLEEIVDPGDYLVKVLGLPLVNAGRYIDVQLCVLFDGEEIAVLKEFFDIRRPRKLIRFLAAIGQPCSETQRFNITTLHWRNAQCNIRCVLKEWETADGQRKRRNIILEFSPC